MSEIENAAETIVNEVVPVGGIFQSVPVGSDAGVTSGIETPTLQNLPKPTGAKLRRREDEDDLSNETTFETVVKLSDGRSFNVDIFTDAEYDAWSGWMKEFGEGLKTSPNPDTFFAKHAATINGIIANKVKGRDGYATTAEKRLKMFFPDKVELVEGIAGKSKVGHDASAFLG